MGKPEIRMMSQHIQAVIVKVPIYALVPSDVNNDQSLFFFCDIKSKNPDEMTESQQNREDQFIATSKIMMAATVNQPLVREILISTYKPPILIGGSWLSHCLLKNILYV
jgi:hypothetical protein